MASIVAPDAQIAVVLEYLARMSERTQLVVCSGNHDLDDVNALDERAAMWLAQAAALGVAVDGARLDTPDVLVTVCRVLGRSEVGATRWGRSSPPTQHCVRVGRRAVPGSGRITRRPTTRPRAGPVHATTATTRSNTWIDAYSPDIVLCGHVHRSPFAQPGGWHDRMGSTLVFNAGAQIGPVPTHIELDTGAESQGGGGGGGGSRWSSSVGIEEFALVGISTRDPGPEPT